MNALSPYSVRKNEDGTFSVFHEYYGEVARFPTDREACIYIGRLDPEQAPPVPVSGTNVLVSGTPNPPEYWIRISAKAGEIRRLIGEAAE